MTDVFSRAATVEDLKALLRSLNDRGAEYILIGGYALHAHGYQRATTDIDLLVDSDKGSILRSVRSWRTASALLQRERWDRLRAMTEEECREAVVDRLSLPYPDLPEKTGSGLVEQQKAFHRIG